MKLNPLFSDLLKARGIDLRSGREFLNPDYDKFKHDPFLLPDMTVAVKRLVQAKKSKETVVIYGDYDIDGLTATALLLDAFKSFGILAECFIPNRFEDGYGLNIKAIETLAQKTKLIITVDCGSLSFEPIKRAKQLGVDVIVTDHHSVEKTMPSAIAVINPKRTDHKYPFVDLAGVGVAFKLVQALQTKLKGLPAGQEKWLLDLVALGTVCDVVTLLDENRANVFWGLKVMQKTRRVGLKALMAVAGIDPKKLTARSLGFGLGPRLNASGRLQTALISLELLTATDGLTALNLANQLQKFNQIRRAEQDKIFGLASLQAEALNTDSVLVLSHPDWNHGIVGIVAAKILERFKKPSFIIQELKDGTAKGSARSFGEFSAVTAIRATEKLIIQGGGHHLAAGITLEVSKIGQFRKAVNLHYKSLNLKPQDEFLEPKVDVLTTSFEYLNEELLNEISRLEPFGHGNPEPVFCFNDVVLAEIRQMGTENQHVRLKLSDKNGLELSVVGFNVVQNYATYLGEKVTVCCNLTLNEWKGNRNLEGRLLKLEAV